MSRLIPVPCSPTWRPGEEEGGILPADPGEEVNWKLGFQKFEVKFLLFTRVRMNLAVSASS